MLVIMEGIQTLLELSPQFVLELICQFYPWKEKQLEQYEGLLSWEYISKNEKIIWSEAIINRHSDKLDFGYWGLPMNNSMFINGAQLMSIGIIGEYISRINNNVLNRPLYVIKETNLK